jgi:hypothetical protein
VIIEKTSPKRPFAKRYTTLAVGAVVVVAAVVFGITLFSGPPLPVLNASYKCLPGSLIPQLKPGQVTTLDATYGGFTATFRSAKQVLRPGNYLSVGTPLKGTFTMSVSGTSWTLPRPSNVAESQIDALCVIAFTPEQHPGVMVEGYTGGAHCCLVPVIYLFSAARNRYVKVVDMTPTRYKDPHAFDGNLGFIPKVVGGQVLLSTGNGDFDYAFGCYACSTEPLALDSVGANGLTDVTPQHPSLVEADAQTIWKIPQRILNSESTSQSYSLFGFLAPWVADECTLGRGAHAWSTIEQLNRQGKLSDALYHQATQNHGSFVAGLHTFLLREDYCTGQI